MSWAAVVVAVVGLFLAVRVGRAWAGVRRHEREIRCLAAMQAGPSHASGNGTSRLSRSARPDRAPGDAAGLHHLPWWPAALDMALGGLDEIQALTTIDPHVIEAMDFWLKPDLSDFTTLKQTVADASASPGFDRWLDTLKGYVGEQVAADVLESQGAVVEFASAPNQAGWDLLVNGEPFNVKVGVDPEHIARHFERYPDVGVITSPELAAHFPEHADQIVALPELSNPVLEHATQQTVEGIGGVGWDFHVPVITLVVSGLRELNSLFSGKTDVPSSLRNVALDAAGTGGGGFVGGKMGAGIGAAIAGPVGAVIGGIVGAIAGAIFGRSLSNHVKTAPLRQAIADFEAERARIQEELHERYRQSREQTLAYIRDVEAELHQTLSELERGHRARANEAKAAFEQAVQAFVRAVPERLEAAAARLARQEREVLRAMPRSPWWVRAVWPSAHDLRWRAVQVWFEGERRALRRAAARARWIAESVQPTPAAYDQVLQLLQEVRLQVPELAEAIVRLEQEHARTLMRIGFERHQARLEAKEAVRRAGARIATFIAHQARHLHAWAGQRAVALRSLRRRIDEEAARLGMV